MKKKYYNFKDLGNEYKNIEKFSPDCSSILSLSVENGGECCIDTHCDSLKCLSSRCCKKFDPYCTSCDSSGNCTSCNNSEYVIQNGECTHKLLLKSEVGESCTDNSNCATNMCKEKCCNQDVYDNNYLCAECDSSGNCKKCPTTEYLTYEFLDNNSCGIRKSNGKACTGNKDCKNLNCVNGFCKGLGGETCIKNNECKSNKCLMQVCCKENSNNNFYDNCEECVSNKKLDEKGRLIPNTERVGECKKCSKMNRFLDNGTCGMRKGKDDTCNGDLDCWSKNCLGGKCSYKSKIGESCEKSSDCEFSCLGGICCSAYHTNCDKCNSKIENSFYPGSCKECKYPFKFLNNWTCGERKNKGETCEGEGECKTSNCDCKSLECKNGKCIGENVYSSAREKYKDIIGKITPEELQEVRGKLSYSMYKKFKDMHNYVRSECKKENPNTAASKRMKVDLEWDWELYDYAYFASKVTSDFCQIIHSPYAPNGLENMVGYKSTGYDRRTYPGAFNYFVEAGMDAYTQEGHKYNKFLTENTTWKRLNHYSNINNSYNDKYACFVQFSNHCPFSINGNPLYGGIHYCYYRGGKHYASNSNDFYENHLACRNPIRIPGHGNGRSTSYNKGFGSGASNIDESLGGADWGTHHAPDELQGSLNVEGDSSKPENKVKGTKFECNQEEACISGSSFYPKCSDNRCLVKDESKCGGTKTGYKNLYTSTEPCTEENKISQDNVLYTTDYKEKRIKEAENNVSKKGLAHNSLTNFKDSEIDWKKSRLINYYGNNHQDRALAYLDYIELLKKKYKKGENLTNSQLMDIKLKDYYIFLLKLPQDAYSNPPPPPSKPDKLSAGEFCKNNSDCESNKCLGGVCCSENMDDPNCNTCNSFLFNNIPDNPPGMCNYCNRGWIKEKDRNEYCIKKDQNGNKGKNNLSEKCSRNSDCDTDICIDNICSEKKNIFEKCNVDSDCSTGICRSNMCCNSELDINCGKCFPKNHEYQGWCKKCKDDYFKDKNNNLKCTEKKLEGKPCYKDNNCKSNKCIDDECKICNYKDHCYNSKCRTDNSDNNKPWCYIKENSKDICNIDGGSGYGNEGGKNYSYTACNNWNSKENDEKNTIKYNIALERKLVEKKILFKKIKTESPEIKTPSPEIKTQSPEIKTQSPEINNSSLEIKTTSPEIKTPSREIKTPSREIKTPSREIKTPSPKDNIDLINTKEKKGINLKLIILIMGIVILLLLFFILI